MEEKKNRTFDKKSKSSQNILNEPSILYSTGSFNPMIILKEATKVPESQMTPFEKIEVLRDGVLKKDLENLKRKSKLDYDQLAASLSVARATLINKKATEKFNASLSEKILGVAAIYSYGFEVFEDETRFNDWIFKPNAALGHQKPFDFLNNQFGREEIKNLIGRIEYGVYS